MLEVWARLQVDTANAINKGPDQKSGPLLCNIVWLAVLEMALVLNDGAGPPKEGRYQSRILWARIIYKHYWMLTQGLHVCRFPPDLFLKYLIYVNCILL